MFKTAFETFQPAIAVAVLFLSANGLRADDLPVVTKISSDDLLRVINDKDWVIVDTRNSNAYNGWALDRVKRGGHIPGAVDFPASWLAVPDSKRNKKLLAALSVKGIESHKHVVLYGTNESDRRRVADYLHEAGFRQLYDFRLQDWAADQSKPLVRYANFQLLVPAAIVKQLLDGGLPETFEDSMEIKFVEVSWGKEEVSYAKGHVPRSFHVNTDDFEPPPTWKLGDPDQLTRFAQKYGFQSRDTVIISGADPTASFRLAIVLRYMGVRDARVLNGGFAAWQAAGYEVETRRNLPPKARSFGQKIPGRPELIDDVDAVKAGLAKSEQFELVDTRTWAEFVGQTSGYKYHKHKGRIPGSVFGQADFKGSNSLTPYRNINNTMRNADEIRTLWKRAGVNTDKQLSFMCGGGWRAAEVLTFAQVIGVPKTSLYSDGWIGWSNDRSNPVESGDVPVDSGR